jgi:hypothetical protein
MTSTPGGTPATDPRGCGKVAKTLLLCHKSMWAIGLRAQSTLPSESKVGKVLMLVVSWLGRGYLANMSAT